MGNWKIVIEGIGAHHNDGYAGDANELGKALVEQLARAGQTVTAARFEHGASGNYDNLMAAPPTDPVEVQTSASTPEAPVFPMLEERTHDVQEGERQPEEPTDLQDASNTEAPQ